MRKLILTMATVGALGMAPAPVPADAATAGGGLVDAWHTCDRDFPSSESEELIAIRGWCYLIRWGICLL